MTLQKIQNVTIKLIEDCIGRPIREMVSPNQVIRFMRGETITSMGVDGHMSVAGMPDCIEWINGKMEDLKLATRVEVLGGNGRVITAGNRNTNRAAKVLPDGVQFWIGPAA